MQAEVPPLLTTKEYSIQTSLDGDEVSKIYVREFVSAELQVFTWPSSLVLSCYLVAHPELVRHKTVCELGAGTGLPSIVCSLLLEPKLVFATERADEPELLDNLVHCIQLNGQAAVSKTQVLPLNWGPLLNDDPQTLADVDVVLGADVFYSCEDFAPLMETLAHLFHLNEQRPSGGGDIAFFTTYHERSLTRTLAPHLNRFGMQAQVIPLDSFLHNAHAQGQVQVELKVGTEALTREQILPSFEEEIYLLRISRAPPSSSSSTTTTLL